MLKNNFILLYILCLGFNSSIVAQNLNLSNNEISKLIEKATSQREIGNYEKSLLNSRVALQNATLIKENNLTALSYNCIAANFDELGEPEKAFTYYNKALFFVNKTNNNSLKHKINNNLGNIYCFDKKQYEIGVKYYKKSLAYSEKIKDTSQLVFTNLNITWAYFDINQFENGLPYLNFINKYHQKFGDQSINVALNMLNGMYYESKNENELSEKHFKKAIELGENGNEKSDLAYSYQEYSNFLFKNKEFKKAYTNLSLYNKVSDKLNIEDKLRKVNVAGINLQIDEYKRNVDEITNAYKTKQNLLEEERKKNKIILIVFLILILLLFFIAYYYSKNKVLKYNNNIKTLQNDIHQNIIDISVDVQEAERKKTALFLHNNISAMLATAAIHLNIYQSKNNLIDEEITKTKSILEGVHSKLSDYSHSLLPVLLNKFGLFYALEDLCEKNSNGDILFEYSSDIKTKTRYSEGFEMKIYYIISELINNTLKHSEAKLAKLLIEENEGKLIFQLSDNGIGFDTSNFEINEGFGLNQIKARVKKLKGDFKVISSKKSGTTIFIKVAIGH